MSTQSHWQLKYGRSSQEDIPLFNDEGEQDGEIQLLEQWISGNDNIPPVFLEKRDDIEDDDEVAQVIKEMENVLCHDFTDTATEDDHSSDDFECDGMMKDFAISFDLPTNETICNKFALESNLNPPNPPINLTGNSLFSADQMVLLFRKGRSDKIARKCLRGLAGHSKREKRRMQRATSIIRKRRRGTTLGRSFLSWKSQCRVTKIKQAALILKFGRVKSIRFREAFSGWRLLATNRSDVERKAIDKHQTLVLCKIFTGWKHITNEAKEQCKMVHIDLATKRTSRIFSAWSSITKAIGASRKELACKFRLAHEHHSIRLLKLHFRVWLAAASRGKKCCNSAPSVASGLVPKENKRPNIVLEPLSSTKKRPSFNSKPPKLVLHMEARRKEREQRRQLLKSKQDERQRQRKDREEEQRKRKEEQELQHQRAYLQNKRNEEEKKKKEAERRRQASLLASLHYKLNLCRRIFKQWDKIFQLMAFNERKAHLYYCDLRREKYFQFWRRLKDDEKRNRLAQIIKQHRLADETHRSMLLAKSFAAWEASSHHTKSILHQAMQQHSRKQKKSVLPKWRDHTHKARTDCNRKEEKAQLFGRRLSLRIAINQWYSSMVVLKKEREIERLVEEKKRELYSWLGDL